MSSTNKSASDMANNMIAPDYRETHDLPPLPAGLSADSLLAGLPVSNDGGRKPSFSALRDTSGGPKSPTKSVVINLPEEPPSKRIRTQPDAAPIGAVVNGKIVVKCLCFASDIHTMMMSSCHESAFASTTYY